MSVSFRQSLIKILPFALMTLFTSNCGRKSSGDEGGGGATFSGNMQNLTGTLSSQSGTPAQMKSWAVALIERDGGVARITDADVSGILKWSKVSFDAAQTAVLLSPDYLVQSIMALPSTKANTVKQYFRISSTTLPQLVQKGSGLSFQTNTGISVYDYYAADSDADGNADGVGSLGLTSGNLSLATVDSDTDGVANDTDVDIDGDGLVNAFDSDDDGDGTLDVLDADSNGNNVNDIQESSSDAYYRQGIEYFAVRYELGASANSLQFFVKVRDGLTPESVKIKSPASLTDSSTSVATDGTSAAWDLTLVDDGTSFDGAAKDLLYARKAKLASGKTPRANQALFAQVTFGTGDAAFTLSYPFTFPNLTLSAITTAYDTTTRVVTLSGNPFGADVQTFVWSVSVTNADGLKVYESTAIAGSTRTLTIPTNVMQSGQTYTYEAVAQTLDKVPGIPALAVRSSAGTINNP